MRTTTMKATPTATPATPLQERFEKSTREAYRNPVRATVDTPRLMNSKRSSV